MKEKIVLTIVIALFLTVFSYATKWVLKRNDDICKDRFGEKLTYQPTFTGGYCFNRELGERKYLD